MNRKERQNVARGGTEGNTAKEIVPLTNPIEEEIASALVSFFNA